MNRVEATVQLAVLVDDNVADRAYNEYVIGKTGLVAKTLSFEDPFEALAFLGDDKREPIELILLDINMPGLDGFRFADRYLELPEPLRGPARLVVFTTSLDPLDEATAMQHPAVCDFVTKPLTAENVRALIERNFE